MFRLSHRRPYDVTSFLADLAWIFLPRVFDLLSDAFSPLRVHLLTHIVIG